MKKIRLLFLFTFLLLFVGCGEQVLEFNYSNNVNTGEIIRFNLTLNTTSSGQNSSVGVAFLIPKSWEVNLVNQTFPINQTFLKDNLVSVAFEKQMPAPLNYEWRGFSGTGYGGYNLGDIHRGNSLINITTPGNFNLSVGVYSLVGGVESITSNYLINSTGLDISKPINYTLSSCSYLSTPGNYDINQDIYSNSNYCFTIVTDNVSIDCHGNSIFGNGFEVGLYSIKNHNVSIKNCKFDSWRNTGVLFETSGSGSTYDRTNLENITVRNTSKLFSNLYQGGVVFLGSGLTLNNSLIENNQVSGISILSSYSKVQNSIILNNSNYGVIVNSLGGDYSYFENLIIENNMDYDLFYNINSYSVSKIPTVFTNITSNGREIRLLKLTGSGDYNLNDLDLASLIIMEDVSGSNLNVDNITILNQISNTNRNGIQIFGLNPFKTYSFTNINSTNTFYGVMLKGAQPICNLRIFDSIFISEYYYFGDFFTNSCFSNNNVFSNNIFSGNFFIKFNQEISLNLSTVGNIWLASDNTGFSQTCEDIDNNSICDSNNTLVSDGNKLAIDFYPQKSYFEFSQPIITSSTTESLASIFPSFSLFSYFFIFLILIFNLL